MFVLIEFKYKPKETRTPPIKNKINDTIPSPSEEEHEKGD